MKQLFRIFVSNWKLIAVLMVLCAVAGYGVSRLLPERTEVSAVLSISIDHHQTGVLTDLEQDRMIGITEDIIRSDAVLAAVNTEMGNFAFTSDQFVLARTNDRWIFTLTQSEPEFAQRGMTLWLKAAHAGLKAAHQAAAEAAALQSVLDGLVHCVQNAVDVSHPVGCPENQRTTQAEIERIAAEIAKKTELAQGLSPAIVIGGVNFGSISVRSLNSAQGILTLAGAGAGLMLALLVCMLWQFPNQHNDQEKKLG